MDERGILWEEGKRIILKKQKGKIIEE